MKYQLLFITLLLTALFACKKNASQTQTKNVKEEKKEQCFELDSVAITDGKLSPEALWNLGRVSGGEVSPDGQHVLYGVSYYSVKQNRSNRDLYLLNLQSGETMLLTQTPTSEWGEMWRPDGKKIGFLAVADGKAQIFEIDTNGENKKQITHSEESITHFRYSNGQTKILYTKEVKAKKTATDIHKDLPKTSAVIIEDLMFRHWDHWEDEKFSHIFLADYDHRKGEVSDEIDIMANQKWDSPLQPWGGIEEITFSPDDREIAYTCKKRIGKDYALSTNSDIYIFDIRTGDTENISKGHMGYDRAPVYSPNGNYIAWTSMERDGFEADKDRIFVYNRETKTIKNYSGKFDQSAGHLTWSHDDQTLYFISGKKATYQLYSLSIDGGKITQITEGKHNYTSLSLLKGREIVASRMSMSMPSELYKVSIADGKAKQLTSVNEKLLGELKMGKVEERWIGTSDGKKMLTWVIYPPDFDPNKRYPTLLYCQGGPQSAVSQFWSYRWNFQIMAAHGYIVVAPNRHGLPTFGQEWNDQISKDYGGQNILDYFAAIDALAEEPFVDENRLGAVGASYGGYSVFHLAGTHEGRFKTFIAHAGIFNFEAMYGSTEELFFVDWDMGGPYWNKNKKNSYSASPHLFVNNWDTPIYIIHGEKDYRIPVTQAMSAFTAAKLKGLKTRFLYYPDENHWILKPQNGVLWQREFFRWLEETL